MAGYGLAYMISIFLVLVGALNWLLVGTLDFDIARVIFPGMPAIVYIAVGLAGLALIFMTGPRDVFLPFLGKTAFPTSVLLEDSSPPDADRALKVPAPPGARVVYWAAEASARDPVENPWDAYGRYKNAGVAIADASGHATLKVRHPAAYKVPGMLGPRTLRPHVHYRVTTKHGMFGPVETAYMS
jgi:uncharacterized membrane protein YuzA (DUF378 family)